MKTLWILLVLIGMSLSEKLDRTYLPPPGAKFSGGDPGDIDVPLKLPKETYPSRSGDTNFGRPEIAIGIDRVGPNRLPEKYGDITPTVPSFQGNSFSFPTTTTSYAFSQTTSYLPDADSTIGLEMSVNSKYPNSISINNSTPGYLGEKYLNFYHNKPYNAYKTFQKSQVLNDDTNSFNNFVNQLSDNEINSQVVQKISDESVHSNKGDIISIPEIHSPSGDLGIHSITSSPTIVNHSLFNNNYDTYNSSPPSELISQKEVNFISSTPIPSNKVYSETLSKSPISRTNTPYAYRTLPERIQSQDREAVILNYENTITPVGYAYSFDTSNGIHADEEGTTINGVQAVGSYSYMGDDGQLYSVSYTADENGFRPHGAHLPTAPPIPDAILKVIEQAALDKANGIYDDGSYDENKYGYRKYNPPKNIQKFPNPYKKDREVANLNNNISNDQLPHHTRFDENLNKNSEINLNDKVHEHNITPKNKLRPFMKNDLINESLSEISPNYKSKHFGNIEKDDEDSNDGNDNQLQNNVSNSVPNLDDGKDKIMSIEVYDETGYHYNRPQNHYSLKAEDNLINRFSDTPASNVIPAMYKKVVENISARPFMTPYVSRNDDIAIKRDDQSLDIPAEYHEDVILTNQKTNPHSTETKMILGKSENGNIHDNKFKHPVPSPSNDNNDNIVSYITSTENGISNITSTLPTAFPSRFNIIESNSQNPLKHSGTSLQNQDALPNHSLDQEDKEAFIHSNKLDSYGDHYNVDNDAGSRYNTPSIYEADKDYTNIHATTKTYNGEDFSGPKRMQAYDPLTGYHY